MPYAIWGGRGMWRRGERCSWLTSELTPSPSYGRMSSSHTTSAHPGSSSFLGTQVARCVEEVCSLKPSTDQEMLTRSVALAHVAATGVPVGVAHPFATTIGLFCGVTIGLAPLRGALLTL